MNEPGFGLAACQHCGQRIEFPQEGAGTAVACPSCEQATVLQDISAPVTEATEMTESAGITAGELKAALAGTVQPPRISVFYQLGLLLVAMFMVLLPVVYLAFVALLAYATYWYGDHARVMLEGFTGGIHVFIIKVILYLGPLIGGTIAVFFMFKPILARPRRTAEPEEMNPARQARLYQFIAHLCDMLQVPMPRRIYLDSQLNASAGFRRGLGGLLGNDRVLTLGLPLVAGLNTRQLAAVVAHELGHCTQGMAMRLGYVIDRIDGWFVRVVYARDSWDVAFEEWADSINDWRLSLIVVCARLAIWASRRILAMLLWVGHAASCFLSRQMEYHADACAVAVAGSAGLESLLLRLREQSVLQNLAFRSLNESWKKRRQLPDSLPEYLRQLESRMPPDFHEQAQQTLLNETSGWFATHPTPAQRIQKARQQAAEGVFVMEQPAGWLFQDFAGTARVATEQYYRQDLQLPVTEPMLRPVADFFPDRDGAK